jgi:hypothetical protein
VTFLSLHEIDLASLVIAALVAGYLMALAGLWAGRVPGFVAVDIADFGRRYMVSDRPSAWVLGAVSHLVNSVIFALAWAMAIEPNLHWWRPLEAILWGECLALGLAGGLIAPMASLGFLGWKTGGPKFAITTVMLHALWGFALGLLYVPR